MMRLSYEFLKTPDGARIRYGCWHPIEGKTPPETVIILQGRASFMEKFAIIIEGLLKRNYIVWSFDWRGQGLSSRMLPNRHKGHIDSYDTYLKDFHYLMQERITPSLKGPAIILGQSMGSHLALRYLSQYDHPFKAAVLTAPLLELNTGGYSKGIAETIARSFKKMGFGESFVMGHDVYNPSKEPFEGNMLTHDRESFFYHRTLQKINPHLSIGGVTYDWVVATFDSVETLNNPDVLKKIKIPVLFISAGEEVVVDNSNIETIIAPIPLKEHIVYEDSRHQILSEKKEIMERFWSDFSAFTEKHLPSTQEDFSLTKRRLIKTAEFSGVERIYPTLPNDFNRLEPHL